jgi:thiol-disulfide isomerase/thioredoxin
VSWLSGHGKRDKEVQALLLEGAVLRLCRILRNWLVLGALVLAPDAQTGLAEGTDADTYGGVSVRIDDESEQTLESLLPEGPVILHFWATWCAPCREELPELDRFRQALDARGMAHRLLAISVDTFPPERVQDFLAEELNLPDFHTVQGMPSQIGGAFRILGYPATIVLDSGRREIFRHIGDLRWSDPQVAAEMLRLISPDS